MLLCLLFCFQGLPRPTNHSATQSDLESKVPGRTRTKLSGPVGRLGPFRHWTVHSLFNRTSSSVGPMHDRVSSVTAYNDSGKVKPKVNVKDNDSKVTKHCDQNKSSTAEESTVQPRLDSFLANLADRTACK